MFSLAAFLSIIIILVAAIFRSDLLARWYANLGAVQMSQVELSDFPSGAWDDGSRLPQLEDASQRFHQALSYDPENRTANHRLGLIDMMGREYANANAHLEAAYQADPAHPGIRKNLGYSYTWVGEFDQALSILQAFPEANS